MVYVIATGPKSHSTVRIGNEVNGVNGVSGYAEDKFACRSTT